MTGTISFLWRKQNWSVINPPPEMILVHGFEEAQWNYLCLSYNWIMAVIAVSYLGTWILCEDCVIFPDLLLSGNYILQDMLLCCLHFEQALIGYLHKGLNTDKEILILQEACWHRDNSRYLLEEGKRKELRFDTDWQYNWFLCYLSHLFSVCR